MAWILEKKKKDYADGLRALNFTNLVTAVWSLPLQRTFNAKKKNSVNTPARWRQKVWYTELKQLDNQMCWISRWGGNTKIWLLNAVQHIFSWETKWKTPQYWKFKKNIAFSLLAYLIISNCILNQKLCNSIVKTAKIGNLSKTKWQMLIEFGNSYYKHNIYEQQVVLHQLPIGVLANKLQYCISYCKIYKKM